MVLLADAPEAAARRVTPRVFVCTNVPRILGASALRRRSPVVYMDITSSIPRLHVVVLAEKIEDPDTGLVMCVVHKPHSASLLSSVAEEEERRPTSDPDTEPTDFGVLYDENGGSVVPQPPISDDPDSGGVVEIMRQQPASPRRRNKGYDVLRHISAGTLFPLPPRSHVLVVVKLITSSPQAHAEFTQVKLPEYLPVDAMSSAPCSWVTKVVQRHIRKKQEEAGHRDVRREFHVRSTHCGVFLRVRLPIAQAHAFNVCASLFVCGLKTGAGVARRVGASSGRQGGVCVPHV